MNQIPHIYDNFLSDVVTPGEQSFRGRQQCQNVNERTNQYRFCKL